MPRRSATLALGILVVLATGCSDGAPAPAADPTTTTRSGLATAAPPGEVASRPPVPSAGCDTSTATPVSLERRSLGDTDRWYLVTVPATHDGVRPLPVVLDFHGLSEGADLHSRTSGLGAYAESHDFVAVLPNGTGTPVRWSFEPDRSANTDLMFVDDLLDELESSLCLDTSRVYATGFSNGALLSSTIACTMADRFTAVAPVAGLAAPTPCDAARAVPVLGFHGTADPILLFNGGVGGQLGRVLAGGQANDAPPPEADLDGEGYPAAAATWAARNGCEADSEDVDLTASVIERTWDCPPGAAVVFEIMVGAGHSWPGSEFTQSIEGIVGPTDMSIDGTDMIWRFFQRFALPGP